MKTSPASDSVGENSASGEGSIVRCLTDNAQLLIFSYSLKIKALTSWTDNLESILGVKGVAVARDANLFLRHVHPDDRFLIMDKIEAALQGLFPYRQTYRWIRPDTNEVRWLHCRGNVVKHFDGEYFEGVISDLTDEIRSLGGEPKSGDSLSEVLNSSHNAIITLDKDLRILRVNNAAHRSRIRFDDPSFNFSNFREGKSFLDCFSDESHRAHYTSLLSQILSGDVSTHQERLPAGERFFRLELRPIHSEKTVQGVLIEAVDISEVTALEQKLTNLEKTEGMRTLAIGLTHNFNNALQGIMGQAITIQDNAQDVSLVRRSAELVVDVAKKASRLTGQLFELEQKGSQKIVSVDLNLSAMAAVNSIEDIFSSGLKIAVAFGNPPMLLANEIKIQSLIERLLRIVRTVSAQGANITITTFQVSIAEGDPERIDEGVYAKLSIASTPEEPGAREGASNKRNLELLIEEVAKDFRRIDASLLVEKSKGAEFVLSVYFPVHGTSTIESEYRDQSEEFQSPPDVLVIDDDVLVLETAQHILEDAGLQCAVAEDFGKALRTAERHSESIRIVLLDALMPGMNGPALLRKLRAIKKDFAIIGFSGAPPEITKALMEEGAMRVLRKPVSPTTLREVVKECLSSMRR